MRPRQEARRVPVLRADPPDGSLHGVCRTLKVLVVASRDRHDELRRTLSSIEYEIAGAVQPGDAHPAADVAVVVDGDAAAVEALRAAGMKVVAVGAVPGGDLTLAPGEIGSFASRVWELFRAR